MATTPNGEIIDANKGVDKTNEEKVAFAKYLAARKALFDEIQITATQRTMNLGDLVKAEEKAFTDYLEARAK